MYLITFKKFREITGVSRTQAYRFFQSGRLTPHHAGRMILIDLNEWNETAVELPDAINKPKPKRAAKEGPKVCP